jgi:hypothetical protein
MRRWVTALVVVLAVLDVVVIAVGIRTRSGVLPAFSAPEASYRMIPAGSTEPEPTPTAGGEASLVGPVLMAVDAEGLVLRATRGACEARFDNPTQVAIGSVKTAAMTPADLPDLAEVLGVAILPGDHLRVSGLDHKCRVMTVDSTDSGQTWRTLDESQPAGVWRFDPDTTAESVTGPAGSRVPVDCVPSSMTNLPAGRGAITCQGGVIDVLTPGFGAAPLSVPGYENLSVAGAPRADRYFVFGSTPACPAQVAALRGAQQSVTQLDCVGVDGAVPQAIAAAGGYVVVQIGDDVMVSEDAGQTFVAAG